MKSQHPDGRRRRVTVSVALGAATLLTLAACSSSASSTGTGAAAATAKTCSNIPAGPINVYNIIPLTGPTATSGQLIQAIAGVAAAQFNAHTGGICGHQVVVHNLDDKGDPATSLGIARQLVAKGGNPIISQDSFGAAENLIHTYLMSQKVLILNGNGAYSLYSPQQNPYAFSVGPSNAEYAKVMVSWAKTHNYNNIGILNDGSSFGTELTNDALADMKTDGLKLTKVVTYSATSVDLATPVTELKHDGAQTIFPTGFTDVLQIVQAIKAIGWSPHIVGWGNLAIFGVTQSQVPPGTVDSCDYHYTTGQPTSTILTPTVTTLLKAEAAKIGINSETSGVLGLYEELQALAHAVVTANSLSGPKLAAVLDATTDLQTVVPGLDLSWSTNQVHNGYPLSNFTECTMQNGPYDIRYAAPAS